MDCINHQEGGGAVMNGWQVLPDGALACRAWYSGTERGDLPARYFEPNLLSDNGLNPAPHSPSLPRPCRVQSRRASARACLSSAG